jgi:hypothetical protein
MPLRGQQCACAWGCWAWRFFVGFNIKGRYLEAARARKPAGDVIVPVCHGKKVTCKTDASPAARCLHAMG